MNKFVDEFEMFLYMRKFKGSKSLNLPSENKAVLGDSSKTFVHLQLGNLAERYSCLCLVSNCCLAWSKHAVETVPW